MLNGRGRKTVSFERIDLNLFRVFEAILQQRSVAAAAKSLGVTPSAVSHALSRLRRALDDQLFIPGDGGTGFLDEGAHPAAVGAIVFGTLGSLADALDSGFMVSHKFLYGGQAPLLLS